MKYKGFFFTVTMFLVLAYILISLSIWVKSLEISENSYAEFYRESTLQSTMYQLTPEKVDNLTNLMMTYNLYLLSQNSVTHPLANSSSAASSPAAQDVYITAALNDLLTNGTTDPSYFVGDNWYVNSNSSLSAWGANLNSSLNSIGLYLNNLSVSNFQVSQTDPDSVNYSFDLNLSIESFDGSSSLSRVYYLNNSVNLGGFVDPAIERASGSTIFRKFYFNSNYTDSTDIVTSQVSPVYEGQGWIYGPLAYAGSPSPDPDGYVTPWNLVPFSNISSYILVGSYSQIVGVTDYQDFGGYIITSPTTQTTNSVCTYNGNNYYGENGTFDPLTYSGSSCTIGYDLSNLHGTMIGKPFVVAPSFNVAQADLYKCPSNSTTSYGSCVLIINTNNESTASISPSYKLENSSSGIYSIEQLRDFAMCGYYTHDPTAPSFIQRLFSNSYTFNDSQAGIETFIIGEYANNPSTYDTHGRLDPELLSTPPLLGTVIRGMPGCISDSYCPNPTNSITGLFAVNSTAFAYYNITQIACSTGSAGGCG